MSYVRSTLVLPFLVLLTASVSAGEPFRFPEGKLGKTAELKYHGSIPVLVVEGTPGEMGSAAGKLALKPANRVLDYPRALLERFSAGLFWGSAVKQGKEMYGHFPDEFKNELEAVVKSSGADRDKVIAGNTLFDIKKMFFCSALLIDRDRSSTGGPLLGRNLDYPGLGWVHEYSLVTVYRPQGKHAFVSVGFPGIIGTLSGMNDAGLTVAILEVFAARSGEGRFDPKGLPYALCYRTLLEECTTIAEAKKKLESLPRTTITNLVIADRQGVAVLEVSPKSVLVRHANRGTLSCTNHFCTELKGTNRVDVARSYERFETLEQVRQQKQKIQVDQVRKALDAVNLGQETLQTMVFEPATLKLHLAIGSCPSSSQPLETIDLKPLFSPPKQ